MMLKRGLQGVREAVSGKASHGIQGSQRSQRSHLIQLRQMSKAIEKPRKVTISSLNKLKKQHMPITVLTCYDYPTAKNIEHTHTTQDGINIALVGDSLAFTALGYTSTSQLTLDEMIHHCKAVSRGASTPLIIADIPFGYVGLSDEAAVGAAIRLVREGGVDGVKIEGGAKEARVIAKVVDAGVPVIAHAGLQPQRATQTSGFRVQGKTAGSALSIVEDCKAVQEAGAFAVLLEAVPPQLGDYITERLKVPTIGIGAGGGTDGQVLVQNDMVGAFDAFRPRFVRVFGDVGGATGEAIESYAQSVRARDFPSAEESYTIEESKWNEIREHIEKKERQQE